jgi:hypothetical protein
MTGILANHSPEMTFAILFMPLSGGIRITHRDLFHDIP